jgi:hypothetical protein
MPPPIGKATDIPAIEMEATSKSVPTFQIKPPTADERRYRASACARSDIKLLPWLPRLPKVKAIRRANRTIPME